jgi:excisionase family DNA binding protein
VAPDRREQQIRDLLSVRRTLPFSLANWLLAELDAARIRLAAVEVELEEMGGDDRATLSANATPPSAPDVDSKWPEWMTVTEFANAIGIGRSMVYELVRRGEVKQARRFGRLIRIHRDALRAADTNRG